YLEAAVRVLGHRRRARDRDREVIPLRPTAVAETVVLPHMNEHAFRPDSERLVAAVGISGHGQLLRDLWSRAFPVPPAPVAGRLQLPDVSKGTVGPGGEHLEAPIGILEDDRVTRDDRSELLPRRPAAAGRDLRDTAENAVGPASEDGDQTIGDGRCRGH